LWTAISFVAWGASNLHLALLRRAMRFGTIARIQVLATLAGSVIAILAAVEGYGYWALVLRPITTALCVASGAWIACCWRPGFPVVDDEVKSMVRFGLHVVGFSITYTLARAVDRIGLSLFYRPDVVGYYQNATTLYENSISLVLSQLNMVGSASLSKLQFDPAALRQKYEAALSALSFFLMPMAAILSVTGEDVTVSLLGQKWQPAGLLLSIIALRGIFQVIEGSQGWIHLSIGRADRWRKWGMVSLGVQIVALLAGLPFGAKGVAAAGVIASLLIAVPTITYAGRPIDIGSAVVMRAVGRQLIGAVSIVAAGWCVKTTLLAEYSSPVRILLSVAFCACLYLVIVVGIFRLAEPVKVASSVVRDLLRGR
jgi:PST family polysaccharide transporter